MNFGKLLVQLRTERKILQKELAAYLNVTVGTISNYENGVHTPDLMTLCKLADYFGVSTDYLLGRTNFRYNVDILNKKIAIDVTAGDIINTTLEFNQKNLVSLIDFMNLLKLRNLMYKDSSMPNLLSVKE